MGAAAPMCREFRVSVRHCLIIQPPRFDKAETAADFASPEFGKGLA